MGVWSVLIVLAQGEGLSLKPKEGLLDLQGITAELADQTENAALQGKVRYIEGA
jgi:hypothetical protein